MSKTAGAYVTGLFTHHQWTGAPTQAALAASQLTDYVIWSVHVNTQGDLFYNNEHFASGGVVSPSVGPYIKGLIDAGRSAGALQTVWFSIGAGGVSDFQAIEQILASPGSPAYTNLFKNFAAIYALGADGFDFDYEESIKDPVGTIATLGAELHKQLGALITYCPYWNQPFWIQCLEKTLQIVGSQPVKAYRLQCYSGGAGNDPTDWANTLAAAGSSTGVSDAVAFIRPGLAVAGSASYPSYPPSGMTPLFQRWGSSGGWIWNTEEVMKNYSSTGYSIADYAAAILAGVK